MEGLHWAPAPGWQVPGGPGHCMSRGRSTCVHSWSFWSCPLSSAGREPGPCTLQGTLRPGTDTVSLVGEEEESVATTVLKDCLFLHVPLLVTCGHHLPGPGCQGGTTRLTQSGPRAGEQGRPARVLHGSLSLCSGHLVHCGLPSTAGLSDRDTGKTLSLPGIPQYHCARPLGPQPKTYRQRRPPLSGLQHSQYLAAPGSRPWSRPVPRPGDAREPQSGAPRHTRATHPSTLRLNRLTSPPAGTQAPRPAGQVHPAVTKPSTGAHREGRAAWAHGSGSSGSRSGSLVCGAWKGTDVGTS